jgi:hypothetical protein
MPGKMARSDPRPSVRVARGAGSRQHLASVLQEGRENANIDAGLGFIWRISAKGIRKIPPPSPHDPTSMTARGKTLRAHPARHHRCQPAVSCRSSPMTVVRQINSNTSSDGGGLAWKVG